MKLLTDENDNPVFSPAVMDAIWLINDETDALTIIPLECHDFEICGTDADEIILSPLSTTVLLDEDEMSNRGYTLAYPWQRRYCSETGYFTS